MTQRNTLENIMKTQINQATQEFKPVNLMIRLETPEELKQFLLLTSVLTESSAYADELPVIGLGNERQVPKSTRLAEFVDAIISRDQWHELAAIYKTYRVSVV